MADRWHLQGEKLKGFARKVGTLWIWKKSFRRNCGRTDKCLQENCTRKARSRTEEEWPTRSEASCTDREDEEGRNMEEKAEGREAGGDTNNNTEKTIGETDIVKKGWPDPLSEGEYEYELKGRK